MLDLITDQTPSVAVAGVIYYRLPSFLIVDEGRRPHVVKPLDITGLWDTLCLAEKAARFEAIEYDLQLQGN